MTKAKTAARSSNNHQLVARPVTVDEMLIWLVFDLCNSVEEALVPFPSGEVGRGPEYCPSIDFAVIVRVGSFSSD
jgi:hypothetical protein